MSSSQLRWVLHSQPLSGAFQCLNKKRQLCLPVRRESVNQVDNTASCCHQVQRESACGNPYVCNIKELSLKDTGERLPSPLSFPLLLSTSRCLTGEEGGLRLPERVTFTSLFAAFPSARQGHRFLIVAVLRSFQ